MEDQGPRAKQKQLSREHDEMRLKSGEISPERLKRDNSFFLSIPIRRFKIAAIGGKPLKRSI